MGIFVEATLWQFVSMTSGVKRNASRWWGHLEKPIVERRYELLRENLVEPPVADPGSFHYSNLGYMVAGAMAERVSGFSWERLMHERLFAPLAMDSAGFGPPGRIGEVVQPWGHTREDVAAAWVPYQQDNPVALGPAGTVHVSLEDWGKFLGLWLPEEAPSILDRRALDRLIEPTRGNYAAGWRVWFGREGKVIGHDGSNTHWYVSTRVVPDRGQAYLVAANSAERELEVSGHLVGEIIDQLVVHGDDPARVVTGRMVLPRLDERSVEPGSVVGR